MAQIVSESVLVPSEPLRIFVRQCLEHSGLSSGHALLVADSLVESNLRGIDSHGTARLPHYLNRIRHGSINPLPNLVYSKLGAAVGRLDADHGLGQIAMARATEEAIALARESGAGWVAVENSSHCGALAYYGQQMAKAGMVGILFTHSDSMVVPHATRHTLYSAGCRTLHAGSTGPQFLSKRDGLIARQLDAHCRDVTD